MAHGTVMGLNRRNLWYVWALLVGAAYVITAIVAAPGMTYAIVAIVAGLGFLVIARTTRQAVRSDNSDAG
jgi:hypothetical protein